MQQTVPVLSNRPLARDSFCIRLHSPEIAVAIRPGQFVMLRTAKSADPLLGRPFALYDTVLDDAGRPVALDIVYLVVGKLTRLLAGLSTGDRLEIWGPLGNGFAATEHTPHVGFIAGGIGQTPFLACTRDLLGTRGYGGQPTQRKAERVSLLYGVRSAEFAAGVDDFRSAGAQVHLATDDGSAGHHGFVTSLLENTPAEDRPNLLFGCGPEPMLKALAELAARWHTPCQLSLESPMACGIGICFSCVAKVQVEDGWDYRRVCVDGPVFEASKIVW